MHVVDVDDNSDDESLTEDDKKSSVKFQKSTPNIDSSVSLHSTPSSW